MANTSNPVRMNERIYNGPLTIGDGYTLCAAPHRGYTLHPAGPNANDVKLRGQATLALSSSRRGAHDEGRAKQLFGQPPVLSGSPATDVTRREELRGQ